MLLKRDSRYLALFSKFQDSIEISIKMTCVSRLSFVSFTVSEWDSMGRVVTQTRDKTFQTLGRAFDFLLNLQKLG